MTLLALDDRFTWHETGNHPENSRRITTVIQHLEARGLAQRCDRMELVEASREQILRVHSEQLLKDLETWTQQGGGQIEVDTVMSSHSYQVARWAAGTLTKATEQVWQGQHPNACCLIRPPGHHARISEPMGFCLLNSIAIAAAHAVSLGAERVLIVDFDVHHGNGTQEIFYDQERVAFFSVHRFPFYPGTGNRDETGTGPGLGWTRNLPLPFGTSPALALAEIERELVDFAARVRPEMILVSAGFDAHRLDPVGNLGWDEEHFARLSTFLVRLAQEYCEGRIVSALEGGYHPRKLAESVETHLQALLATSSAPSR